MILNMVLGLMWRAEFVLLCIELRSILHSIHGIVDQLYMSLQVTGAAQYCDDIVPPRGMLHAALVVSSKAHAKLVSVDASAAREVCALVSASANFQMFLCVHRLKAALEGCIGQAACLHVHVSMAWHLCSCWPAIADLQVPVWQLYCSLSCHEIVQEHSMGAHWADGRLHNAGQCDKPSRTKPG